MAAPSASRIQTLLKAMTKAINVELFKPLVGMA